MGHDMKTLRLDQIRIDGGTQPRVEIDQDVVSEYADDMANGKKFPPVIVFYDGATYWLADGFHRYWAYQRNGTTETDVQVKHGELRDAILYSVGANADHGSRRTNADKRKSVMTLLADTEWGKWSDREIASQCAVGHSFVSKLRTSLSTTDSEPRTYTTKHGTTATMKTANIGKRRERREDDDIEIGNEFPVATQEPEAAPIRKLGVGTERAYEAINILKSIPRDDPLRQDALRIVVDWIKVNK